MNLVSYSKTCVKRPLRKRPKIGFQGQLSINAGQRYCRTLKGELDAILSTFIKLPLVIKIFVLSGSEWPFYTAFPVHVLYFQTEWIGRLVCAFGVQMEQNQVFL